jgi:CheY-like chemotaxis protein
MLRRALADLQVPYRVTICDGVTEALASLRREGSQTAAQPDVIMLDMGTPESERRALLAAIQHDAVLRQALVIAVAESPGQNDIAWSYYLSPQQVTAQTLTQLLRPAHAIAEFWSLVVALFAGEDEATPTSNKERGNTE